MAWGSRIRLQGALIIGVAALALPSTASATFPGDNGLIAFQDDGSGAIYTIKPNGSHREKLDRDGYEPAWSATGKRIAFAKPAGTSGNTDIYTMNANGSDKTRVTRTNDKSEWEPAFSPNGKRIVYRVGDFRGGGGRLYVIDIDGHHRQRLGTGAEPDWSPNGKRIAFDDTDVPEPCLFNTELFWVKPSGRHRTLLPFGCDTSTDPSWSPNGRKLAFSSYPAVGNTDIYTGPKNGDESGEVQLTNLGPYDERPSWSPDGNKIAFGDEDNGLYIVARSSPLAETAIPNTVDVDGGDPAWQPK